MAKETYHGVPRSKIPWGPTIDYERCVGCLKCAEYCHMGVYEMREKDDKKRAVVKNPNRCVVMCTGCQDICPAKAITHPSRKETRDLIQKLRKNET